MFTSAVASTDTTDGGSSVPVGAIAGAIVGVAVVVILILIVGCVMYRQVHTVVI